MRIWLDDRRQPPRAGWLWVKSAEEAIRVLKAGRVTILSLDHDLGEGEKTGMDVLNWIEEQYYKGKILPPRNIFIHSQNAARRPLMELVARRLLSMYDP